MKYPQSCVKYLHQFIDFFSVLDEASSQIGIDAERIMYMTCRDLGITLLSVGHRKSLQLYHHIQLNFNGCGGYDIKPIIQTDQPTEVDYIESHS